MIRAPQYGKVRERRPDVLVGMRLEDMKTMHPKTETDVCLACKRGVGIAPSGQRALKDHPGLVILCVPCALAAQKPGDIVSTSAATREEFIEELRAGRPVGHA